MTDERLARSACVMKGKLMRKQLLGPGARLVRCVRDDGPYLGEGGSLGRLPPLPIEFPLRMGHRFEPATDPAALATEVERCFAAGMRKDRPRAP